MKIGMGAIIGLIGGLLGLVGAFLPWVTITASAGPISLNINIPGACFGGIGSIDFAGIASAPCTGGSAEPAIYFYGILVFSILGLILVLLGKRSTSMIAMIFGLLVLILGGVAVARVTQQVGALTALIPGASAGAGYGLYLCIVGGLLLLIGGFLAMGEAKKAMMAPAPMPMAPPMPPPQ